MQIGHDAGTFIKRILADGKGRSVLAQSNLENEILCPCCNSGSVTEHFLPNHTGNSSSLRMIASGYTRGNRHLFNCLNCKVIFAYPMPVNEELVEEYNSGPDYEFVSQDSNRIETFKKAIMKMPEIVRKKVLQDIVDIGTAGGSFLVALRDLGGEGIGLEPNSWLVNHAVEINKVNVRQGSILSLANMSRHKAISMWDVLEHLPDPTFTIKAIKKALLPEGILVLSLPDTGSLSAKIFKSKWPMHLDVHLFYYSQSSLDMLFEKNGFSRIYSARYPQILSGGYVLLRAIRTFYKGKIPVGLYNFLMSGIMAKLKIRYSIGQRIYVYQLNDY